MALNFPSQKHSVYISVSCESNMMIQFLHYMDHLFLLYRNTNTGQPRYLKVQGNGENTLSYQKFDIAKM